MGTADVRITRTGVDGVVEDLRPLLRDYFVESNERALEYFDDELSGLDVESAVQGDVDRLRDPDIDRPLFLARATGDAADADPDGRGDLVGSVQLKHLTETDAEVKRLYVVPARRGEGIGRRLVERLVDEAAAEGYSTLRLGVGPFLDRARALYADIGFEFTPPYEGTQAPEEIHDDWGFMRYDVGSE